MTQSLLKAKIIAYLRIKESEIENEIITLNLPARNQDLTELHAYINELIAMLKATGRCFALAEIEAAFSSMGYGPWWRETLARVTNWDENRPELLKKVVDLTDYLPPTHVSKEPPKTLDQMFNEVLNYLITEHAYVVPCIRPFMKGGVSQANKLDPKKGFFELVINGLVYSVTSRDVVAGHFPPHSLANLLEKNKEQFIDNICLAHAEDHATNIKYKEGVWIIYDSNYSHEAVETMQKEFTDVLELEKEIKSRLRTESIALQIASLSADKKVALNYAPLDQEQLLHLLNADGLHMIARHSPQKLDIFFHAAGTEDSINNALAKGLVFSNKSQWNGLHIMAHYAPAQLPALFILAEKNKVLALHIASALTQINSDRWTPFRMMVRSGAASEGLISLFSLAQKNPVVERAVQKAMDIKKENGLSIEEMLSRYQPESVQIKALQCKLGLTVAKTPSLGDSGFFETRVKSTGDKKNKSQFKPQT